MLIPKNWTGRRIAKEIYDLTEERDIKSKIQALCEAAKKGKLGRTPDGSYDPRDPYFRVEVPLEVKAKSFTRPKIRKGQRMPNPFKMMAAGESAWK